MASEEPAEDSLGTEKGVRPEIRKAVRVCETFADERFSGDQRFTQVTKWLDGDFRVLVKHGMEHDHSPYSQVVEKVTYRHFDGEVRYAKIRRLIDKHEEETMESELVGRMGRGDVLDGYERSTDQITLTDVFDYSPPLRCAECEDGFGGYEWFWYVDGGACHLLFCEECIRPDAREAFDDMHRATAVMLTDDDTGEEFARIITLGDWWGDGNGE